MPIIKTTKQKELDRISERWQFQYKGYNDPDKLIIGHQLAALAPPISVKTINTVIGNSSWTDFTCDCCNKEVNTLWWFKPFHYDEYDNAGISACETCVKSALPEDFPECSV